MAQKTKVKELVGRGLNSYHTKALQQIHRIEKKNKEQNHKISILSNELDNDYLTKTEEGSVVSLEHSKEGMVYLDELQGNTLVNYCTDGSKELTLNGDIDVEGIFVTTTEGVDNGKIDVMCEGNTLVNLKYGSDGYDCNIAWADGGTIEYFNRQEYSKIHCKGEIVETANNLGISWIYHVMGQVKLHLLKPNTTYTIKLNNKYDCITSILIQAGNATNSYIKSYQKIDKDTYLIITKDSFEELSTNGIILYGTLSKDYKGSVDYKIIGMFEGDWSNKELPNDFFEGMKSVGQDNENGHKIEILSRNDNLFIPTQYIPNGWSFGNMIVNHTLYRSYWIKCKPNTTYFVESDKSGNRFGVCCSDRIELNGVAFPVTKGEIYGSSDTDKVQSTIFTTDATAKYLYVYTTNNGVFPTPKIMISEGTSVKTYIEPKLNKKEILLNEPLRELPNGVKDKFVKIGGKYYVERNCGEIMLNGDEVWEYWNSNTGLNNDYISFYMSFNGKNYEPNVSYNLISDILVNMPNTLWNRDLTSNSVALNADINISLQIGVKKSDLQTQDVVGFKQWLKTNKPKIVYKLKTPFYEPLEIKPTLNTYSDITHISNNSIIPCNMKVKNTGYNAIIKPSTLYTVALDTNKFETIGMNLGGVKGTTTNNVLTLTTPTTLTDDSLRLYGKGIKGSKVRLLEGDKTNWMPSHFEGMQSSFEDKVQDDGSYKMEILNNNKNLLDEENIVAHANITSNNGVMTTINFTNEYGWFRLKLKNTYKLKTGTYYLQFKMRSDGYKGIINEIRFEDIADIKYLKYSERLTNPNCNSDYQIYEFKFVARNDLDINYLFIQGNTTSSKNLQLKDFILSRIETVSYESNKSNKIQFSSIEPLRSVNKNIRDKFIFKDGKLMIERNCIQANLTRELPWSLNKTIPSSNGVQFVCRPFRGWGNCKPKETEIICSKKPTLQNDGGNHSIWVYDKSTIVLQMNNGLIKSVNDLSDWLDEEKPVVVVPLVEPTYEEIPFELQKIILEGYENGTLFFNTNIPPTSTVTYAGETPIVKSVKLNKTEVLNNTEDINDNIIPYLMDMDYRVVMLQLATEELEGGVSMARLFGGTYEMIKRDILSKRLTREEYGYRLADYFNAGKLTEEQVRELEELR